MIKFLKQLFFPPRCVICQRLVLPENEDRICTACIKKIRFYDGEHCVECGQEFLDDGKYLGAFCIKCSLRGKHIDNLCVAFIYEKHIRKALLDYKFNNAPWRASAFAGILYKKMLCFGNSLNFDYVSFVPISKKRLKERGYDQSKLLAKEFSKKSGILFKQSLEKIKDNKTQSSLLKSERQTNVKGAYRAIGEVYKKRILLIDDVYTTGSTINECAKVLKDAGAKEVAALVLACRDAKKDEKEFLEF